ncbi:uncharacterized protein Shrm [Chelonus insularis]|uniref:uncharacterized protein Shrm n=1 Tax=Chelonus insularis TaxID=460826 RepID=UPI00158F019D|nr:uncharacterized protein LOC118066167 [Chelonus insularis]
MTELQPSLSGYRGQDEALDPSSCNSNTFNKSYHTHGHLIETCNYKQVNLYSQDSGGYLSQQQQHSNKQQPQTQQKQQSASRGSSPGEHYRKKTEKWTSENENNVGDNEEKKSNSLAGYNDGYNKKNTPGYKNDSGYSESIGFDSFSLSLNDRDDSSPPPTPPMRDASSLKGICYTSGHEKYPSWPSSESDDHHQDQDNVNNSIANSGSHRSKSWTDQTNYSKEKPVQYNTKPLAKRTNPSYTQQLKTVMERCEKIPVESFESRGSRVSRDDDQSKLWPRVDRDGKSLSDAEYVIPSSPEQEQQPSQILSHSDLNAYITDYQDPQVSQVDIYRETTLTQAGLEEYTRVQHSQQASYAQSEGYHSYVSSVDSTTNTPFLDRLRRDSQVAAAQQPAPPWEETSREGRDSVVTTSSGGSASSSETLKWHGSMSDVSVSSGLPARQVNGDVWPHGSMSDISSVNGGVTSIQKSSDDIDKWQESMSDINSSFTISSKQRINDVDNKWPENKWQSTMNDRNCKQMTDRTSLPSEVISHYASDNDVCQTTTCRESKWQESSIDEETPTPKSKGIHRGWESCMNVDQSRYNHNSRPMPQSSMSQSQQQHQQQYNLQIQDDWNPLHGSMSDVNQANVSIHASSKQLIAHSARVQTPQRHHSESVLYLDRERNQRKLYPVSTTQSQDVGQGIRNSPVSTQKTHLSVADRINELEKQQQPHQQQLQQQMRYTFLDPDKRHRVSDPTLKAIQKKALLSFYERHHHQSSWRSEPQLVQGVPQLPTNHSPPPPQPPPRPRPLSSRRASSASDYATGGWRDKSNRNHNNEVPSPKHQHSNSCGSLSTDLLGPVIVGPAISVDDWVPERPPKKPHLRAIYSDRMPSPDLPPPSPPTITEDEVLNSDVPLPPPPPLSELNERNLEIGGDTKENENIEEMKLSHRHQVQQEQTFMRRPTRKDEKKSSDKSSTVSSLTQNGPKQLADDHNFVCSALVKPVDSDFVNEDGTAAGYAMHRMITTGRSSLRCTSAQKLMVNGRMPSVRRILEERNNLSRSPPSRLPDLVISERYSDSGNQRPALQVPVESRIIRQESMRVESTRINASGLVKMEDGRFESSSRQRPQPQVPKSNGIEKTTCYSVSSTQCQQSSKSNYPALLPDTLKNNKYPENHGYSAGAPLKTSYEANTKLLAEPNPQKYHDPPKYVASNYHHRHPDLTLKNYYAAPPKYIDAPKQIPQPQCPDRFATSPPPPPLAPRQNSSTRKSLPVPPRPAPPPYVFHGSQSKASYLAYKRERGAPDSEGSYKRTMSPTARLEDWPPPRERDDPILLRVTPHHPHQLDHNPNHHDLSKSHSVDALHHRNEERPNAHTVQVIGKLSHELSKKHQASDTRPRSESNNNSSIITNNNDCNNEDRLDHCQDAIYSRQSEKKFDHKDRLSSQCVQILNDRNRQLERERQKLTANCDSHGNSGSHRDSSEIKSDMSTEDIYYGTSATIEMTSKNVQLLNFRNALLQEKRHSTTATTMEVERGSNEILDESCDNESSFAEKSSSPPSLSPPKYSKFYKNEDSGILRSRGAVPRRSGSCSSSSSSSTKLSLEQGQVNSRYSPPKVYSSNSLGRNDDKKSFIESDNAKQINSYQTINSRSKVSSPAQTDSSWIKFEESSQTENMFTNRLQRTWSSGSRSSSLSSVSKISSSSSSLSPRYSPVEAKSSPCVSPQPGIEGLTLVQRTEVVLRVNTTTIDVASQTETLDDQETTKGHVESQRLPESRPKLPEEIECEKLSRDLANQLGPNDKLVPILVPAPEHKKPTDYVSGLFRVETTLQPRLRRPISTENTSLSPSSPEDDTEENKKKIEMPSTQLISSSNVDSNNPLSPTSAYFTTSEGKARFLTQYSQDISEKDVANGTEESSENTRTDNIDLKQKKEELVLRLDRKVIVLRAEQEAVREEGEMNEALGTKVASRINAVARPAEASKYRLHVEEVGKITSLLLGLSGRLARAENALHGMPPDHPERKILESKRDKLLEQLEEAKILKSNIDKRSVNVSAILAKYLNDEEFADYQHFITMKTKLIMDGREIQDKVKLGEEQLAALKEAIG